MKNKLLFFFISVLILSCGNDDVTPNNNNNSSFSVKVNGELWQATLIVLNEVDESTEQFAVSALNANKGETIGFTIDYFAGNGTYPVPKDLQPLMTYGRSDKKTFFNKTASKMSVIVTGTEIVAGVKKAHGTFIGTLEAANGEMVNLTEGKF
ncbi:MAG: hypothetical protein HOP11_12625 [Saprospiraceae bacterium]|nr:hypothetical protein [Saprospiraceae bacterium]